MRLRLRHARESDLPAILPLLRDGFVYDAVRRQQLVRFWGEILATRSGETALLEDLGRPREHRVVGAGISVFVADGFVERARRAERPYLGLQLLELWVAGHSPVLERQAICRAQTQGGLNLFIIHYGWPEGELSASELDEVRHGLIEAYAVHHKGYFLRLCFMEVVGCAEMEVVRRLGGQVWSDYADFFAKKPLPPPEQRPFLFGITREEALKLPGSPIFSVFCSPEPRCAFTPGEQDVLRLALAALTDEAIAGELGLALITVKKRWQAMYQRLAVAGVDLLAETDGLHPLSHRRLERRRLLVEFVRAHPEELRPAPRPPRRRPLRVTGPSARRGRPR